VKHGKGSVGTALQEIRGDRESAMGWKKRSRQGKARMSRKRGLGGVN
jgi:hypothetical protein